MEAVDPVFQTKMLDMLKQTGLGWSLGHWFVSPRTDANIGLKRE